MSIDDRIVGTLKHDKLVVLGAVFLVCVLSWTYLLTGAGMNMPPAEMAVLDLEETDLRLLDSARWDFGYATLMFVMWWVMMIAMMLPSATPMILLFATINRNQKQTGNSYVPTACFVSAYLIVWSGFSLMAVAVQWGLEVMGLLTPMLVSTSAVLGGGLLISAGLYQLTPLKQACLRHCRSPLQFVGTRWRSGVGGAISMGIEHGSYCVGCCWFLMGLLFFGGVMNPIWIAGLAAFVFLEKTIPVGHWFGNAVGIALIVWGIMTLSGFW